jgi:CRP/FNR family cyclic AMP-dependent transcriptional regulator
MDTTRSSEDMAGTLTYRSMSAAAGGRGSTWYIRHVDLFRRLTVRDVDDLVAALSPGQFAPGQLIVGPETQPELVFLMRAGTVRLFHRADNGHETTVERLYAGHLFGVTGFLGSAGSTLLAQAENEVELCVVEGRHFLDILSKWPQALLDLALRLGLRVYEGDEILAGMTASGARARLAAVLHRLALDASETQAGGGVRLRGVPRHSDLAADIGVSRETVTRMLARLEQDGYIRRFGRQIVLPDLERLADDFDLE